MKVLRVSSWVCALLSALILSEAGQVFLVVLMASLTGLPLAFALIILPAATVYLGLVLFPAAAKAPGFVVGLSDRFDRCGKTCAELLMAAPEIRVVLGRFGHIADNDPARPPANARTWGLVPKGIGLCPPPPTQVSSALRIAMAEADLRGYCFGAVPMASGIDLIALDSKLPGDAPGQTHEERRTTTGAPNCSCGRATGCATPTGSHRAPAPG